MFPWGTAYNTVFDKVTHDREYMTFTPGSKPDYKNKIMNYVVAIDPAYAGKIDVLRIKTNPQVDYLFINKKLYNIVQNWGYITPSRVSKIESKLKREYGNFSIQKDGNLHIISYNNSRTKVLLYKKMLGNGKTKCKVYFYTKKLFRMLIMD